MPSQRRDGDTDAFTELFEQHADTVYNYCFRRTASWDVAEDLTAVVYLEAWRSRARLVPHADGTVLPWLYGIAANVCRNQWRSVSRHRRALDRLPPARAVPDHADDVVSRVDDERRMRAVLRGIDALPVSEREVITLIAWEGMDYQAAAVALGVPVGTIRSRLSRARSRLSSAGRPDLAQEQRWTH